MLSSFIKTTLLFSTLSGLLLLMGYLIGGTEVMGVFFLLSLAMNFFSYWFSSTIAIKMSGSKPTTIDQHPTIYQDTSHLASQMGIPMPKIYIAPQQQPNAFATGRNPSNSAISLTQGLLQTLSREEVKAVIAHELAHIKNRDVLTSTIAVVMATTISYISNTFMWIGGSDDRNSSPLSMIGMMLSLIVAPIAGLIIQLAISRTREFAADTLAAQTMGTGKPLEDALMKINSAVTSGNVSGEFNQQMSSLYIFNPFKLSGFSQLFSTHPSLDKRIINLRKHS